MSQVPFRKMFDINANKPSTVVRMIVVFFLPFILCENLNDSIVKHFVVVVVSVIARPEKKRKCGKHTKSTMVSCYILISDLICVSFCRSFKHRIKRKKRNNQQTTHASNRFYSLTYQHRNKFNEFWSFYCFAVRVFFILFLFNSLIVLKVQVEMVGKFLKHNK